MKMVRVLFVVLMLAAVTFGVAPEATASASTGLSCSFVATGDGFNVAWQSNIDADRIIVERYALNRFWWRGRSDAVNGQMQDGPAPKGGASMHYRVTAKDANQKTILKTDCTIEDTKGFACHATKQRDGTYAVEWNGRSTDQDSNYVVRRQVIDGQKFYWRKATNGRNTTDAKSPTGSATYRVLSRTDGVITGIATCASDNVPPPPPVTGCDVDGEFVATTLDQIECDAMTALNDLGLGFDSTIDPCSWTGISCEADHVVGIRLNDHDLRSAIPPQIGNLAELGRLEIRNSGLRGPIPPELANATKLRDIDLLHNDLSGSIPIELASLQNLDVLYLSGNRLTGTIPPELGSMPRLGVLGLSNNLLTGQIPPELGNLTLDNFDLSYNQLTGEIPPELGNLRFTASFVLSNNRLTGEIPPELGNLNRVTGLNLSDNQLTGSIPPELGNLPRLARLYLSGNQMNGDVTAAMTGILDTLVAIHISNAQDQNCFSVTNTALATKLTRFNPGWDTCPAPS